MVVKPEVKLELGIIPGHFHSKYPKFHGHIVLLLPNILVHHHDNHILLSKNRFTPILYLTKEYTNVGPLSFKMNLILGC